MFMFFLATSQDSKPYIIFGTHTALQNLDDKDGIIGGFEPPKLKKVFRVWVAVAARLSIISFLFDPSLL